MSKEAINEVKSEFKSMTDNETEFLYYFFFNPRILLPYNTDQYVYSVPVHYLHKPILLIKTF